MKRFREYITEKEGPQVDKILPDKKDILDKPKSFMHQLNPTGPYLNGPSYKEKVDANTPRLKKIIINTKKERRRAYQINAPKRKPNGEIDRAHAIADRYDE